MSQIWHESGNSVAGLKIKILIKNLILNSNSNYLIINSILIINYKLNLFSPLNI